MKPPRAYSNIIARKRDAKGNPLRRTYVFGPPLVSLDPDALSEVAGAIRERPEDRGGHYLYLKARNAMAAAANYEDLVGEVWQRLVASAERARAELAKLQPEVTAARDLEAGLSSEVAPRLAELGLSLREGQTLDFGEHEPVSLEALAGEHGLPSPERAASWSHRTGYRLLSTIGGGLIFGVSLGLLTDQLDLENISAAAPELVFWAGIGMTVMAMIGSAIRPLAETVGSELYRLGVRLVWLRGLSLWLHMLLLFGIVTAVIGIESRVEQLGLFKGLTEQNSLQTLTLNRTDLGWVSLMLVVPAASSALVLGLCEGGRRANLDRLRHLQTAARGQVIARAEFREAAALLPRLARASARLAELNARASLLEAQIRYELSDEEKRRLEDAEMEVVGHSLAAEELIRGGTERVRRDAPTPGGFWQRLFGCKPIEGSSR